MDFSELFEPVNWQPVMYNGKLIQIADVLPTVKNQSEYNVIFESVNSEWEQGIFFHWKNAHFLVNNKIEKLNACWLWQTDSPQTNNLKILKEGKNDFSVWNIWRIDRGPMSYGHNGAAMFVQFLEQGRRYYCNDGYPDEDFDDLIFQINWNVPTNTKNGG